VYKGPAVHSNLDAFDIGGRVPGVTIEISLIHENNFYGKTSPCNT
jgi:hypothetical protein